MQVEEVRPRGGETAYDALRLALTRPRGMDYHFEVVRLLSDSPCTFLPVEEFRSSDALAFYRLNFPDGQWQPAQVHYDILAQMEVVVLYTIDPQSVQTVTSLFPDAQVCSLAGLWLQDFADANRRLKDAVPHFYVQIEERQMLVSLFEQERLRFACPYPVSNDPDRLYYLLAAWKQLELDGEKNQCTLRGASDVLTANVRRYVRNVSFLS